MKNSLNCLVGSSLVKITNKKKLDTNKKLDSEITVYMNLKIIHLIPFKNFLRGEIVEEIRSSSLVILV